MAAGLLVLAALSGVGPVLAGVYLAVVLSRRRV